MLAILLVATPSQAASSMSSEEFAKLCNETGHLHVATTLHVVGGYGHIEVGCSIFLEPGAEIAFKGANLTGESNLYASGAEFSTVNVVSSSLDFDSSLELTAGCCASEPWEKGGTVHVHDSYLRGSSVYLVGSHGAADGLAIVNNSKIEATGSVYAITIGGSPYGGPKGYTYVSNSAFITAGPTTVISGIDSTTVFKGNDVDRATGAISVSAGGSCASYGNTRAVPCS